MNLNLFLFTCNFSGLAAFACKLMCHHITIKITELFLSVWLSAILIILKNYKYLFFLSANNKTEYDSKCGKDHHGGSQNFRNTEIRSTPNTPHYSQKTLTRNHKDSEQVNIILITWISHILLIWQLFNYNFCKINFPTLKLEMVDRFLLRVIKTLSYRQITTHIFRCQAWKDSFFSAFEDKCFLLINKRHIFSTHFQICGDLYKHQNQAWDNTHSD